MSADMHTGTELGMLNADTQTYVHTADYSVKPFNRYLR